MAVEALLKELVPHVEVERESGEVPALVWFDSRPHGKGEWVEGRLRFDQPQMVAFKGWPELVVDHALVLSRLIGDDLPVVLANDQGETYDLRELTNREALLAAIEGSSED